jgi:hypothetical protein
MDDVGSDGNGARGVDLDGFLAVADRSAWSQDLAQILGQLFLPRANKDFNSKQSPLETPDSSIFPFWHVRCFTICDARIRAGARHNK